MVPGLRLGALSLMVVIGFWWVADAVVPGDVPPRIFVTVAALYVGFGLVIAVGAWFIPAPKVAARQEFRVEGIRRDKELVKWSRIARAAAVASSEPATLPDRIELLTRGGTLLSRPLPDEPRRSKVLAVVREQTGLPIESGDESIAPPDVPPAWTAALLLATAATVLVAVLLIRTRVDWFLHHREIALWSLVAVIFLGPGTIWYLVGRTVWSRRYRATPLWAIHANVLAALLVALLAAAVSVRSQTLTGGPSEESRPSLIEPN